MKIIIEDTARFWEDFQAAMRKTFIPFDHVRRTKDNVRKIVQHSRATKYLNEFRNW